MVCSLVAFITVFGELWLNYRVKVSFSDHVGGHVIGRTIQIMDY